MEEFFWSIVHVLKDLHARVRFRQAHGGPAPASLEAVGGGAGTECFGVHVGNELSQQQKQHNETMKDVSLSSSPCMM